MGQHSRCLTVDAAAPGANGLAPTWPPRCELQPHSGDTWRATVSIRRTARRPPDSLAQQAISRALSGGRGIRTHEDASAP
jgi:hypothetical protein